MEKEKPKRVLQVIGKVCGGGVEAVIMNYYRYINRDEIQFDFVVEGKPTKNFLCEVTTLGGKVYEITPYAKNPIKYVQEITKIVRRNRYNIVHSNMNTMSFLSLLGAKLGGATVRILHNHTTADPSEGLRYRLKRVLRPINLPLATHYLACSAWAAAWMYGTGWEHKAKVIHNAVDIEKFIFNPEKRKQYRKAFALEEAFVIGHVGRLEHQKNHEFLLRVFAEVRKQRKNAKLVLIGEGKLRKALEEQATDLNIFVDIMFLGLRNDVADLYSMMDVFCFPSHYEGLSLVAVEAQANGLKVFAAENVSAETKLVDSFELLPIADGDEKIWGDCVLIESIREQKCCSDAAVTVSAKGFNIRSEARYLEQLYKRLIFFTDLPK